MKLESFINYFLLFVASICLFMMREAIVNLDRRLTGVEDRLSNIEAKLHRDWPDFSDTKQGEWPNQFDPGFKSDENL